MNKKPGLTLLALSLLLLSPISYAQHTLAKRIETVINHVDPNVNIGITVVNLNSGKTVYEKNAHRFFVPASNLKLFTNAAALLHFGSEYRFTTTLSRKKGPINEGVLKGNLYLTLSGDPTLTTEQLKSLFAKLKDRKIKTLQGNILLDTTRFAHRPYGPGWMIDDSVYGYEVKNTPTILDKNAFKITITPSARVGQLARIKLHDNDGHIRLVNELVVKAEEETPCRIHFHITDANILRVEGCIEKNHGSLFRSMAIANPLLYFKNTLRAELKALGIRFTGKIKQGKTPEKTDPVALHHSDPLKAIIRETLKSSDNLYSNTLYLALAQDFFKAPGDWRSGAKALKAILKTKLHLHLDENVLVDGSGLSRYNLVTPHQTVTLLRRMYHQFPQAYDFITALPISGKDGTLSYRMLHKKIQGQVRAKTGTLSGVSTLSGYVADRHQRIYAFSIMINGISGKIAPYQKMEDQICRVIARG